MHIQIITLRISQLFSACQFIKTVVKCYKIFIQFNLQFVTLTTSENFQMIGCNHFIFLKRERCLFTKIMFFQKRHFNFLFLKICYKYIPHNFFKFTLLLCCAIISTNIRSSFFFFEVLLTESSNYLNTYFRFGNSNKNSSNYNSNDRKRKVKNVFDSQMFRFLNKTFKMIYLIYL